MGCLEAADIEEDSPNGSTLDRLFGSQDRDVARKYGEEHRRRQRGSTSGICQTVRRSDVVEEKYAILSRLGNKDEEQCTFFIHRILEATAMATAEIHIEAVLVFWRSLGRSLWKRVRWTSRRFADAGLTVTRPAPVSISSCGQQR